MPLLALLLAGPGGGAAHAQPPPETPPAGPAAGAAADTEHPVVRPPRVPTPPVIDGRLDDPVWRGAAHISQLVQRRPLDGPPASEASDIHIAYDSDSLYLGLHAHYSDPGMMRANRRDRDQTVEDDLFLVYFDPFLDQQRAYVFTVNGYGVQGDAILRAGALGGGRFGVPRGDASWDVLFETAARIVPDGFVAEMAIPFKSLRYPRREAGSAHRWGLQIARIIGGKDEADVWSPTSRDIAGFLPQMGLLDGMTDLSRSHNIEILPTVTATRFGSLDPRYRPVPRRGPVPRGRREPEVRRDVQSHRRRHVQPRLLADRVGPAADRDQPAVRAVLPRAAPLLPRGGRDLQHPGADNRRPHPHHRRSRVRRQADRQRSDEPPSG